MLCHKLVSASAAYSKTPPCVSFLFFCSELPNTASKAQTEKRTRLPLASPGASASHCQRCPPHRGRGSLWRKISSTQEQHAASQHFASIRAPYGHDCLGNGMLWCFCCSATALNQNNRKSPSLGPEILTGIFRNFPHNTQITWKNYI